MRKKWVALADSSAGRFRGGSDVALTGASSAIRSGAGERTANSPRRRSAAYASLAFIASVDQMSSCGRSTCRGHARHFSVGTSMQTGSKQLKG